ncbi:hypothetical protein BRC94_07505 [Halobacteriales archaeon QS_5_70_17]|nr:MAG: hypothetical protein BRC94_07505 [Halobacteriales archaeon QS_5_70_17]
MAYDVRPTEAELSEARALVTVALDACERELDLEDSVRVALGWTDNPPVVAEQSGVAGTCYSGGQVEVGFNADAEGWSDAVGPVVALQYGRAWFDERVTVAFRWQRLLREAFADRFAAARFPDGPRPWRTTEEAAERWTALSDDLSERDDLAGDRATMGVAAAVGRELAAECDLAAFVDRDRSAVAAAGEAAFD